MNEKDKENLIRILPAVILIVAVGTITNYNLLFVVPAGSNWRSNWTFFI